MGGLSTSSILSTMGNKTSSQKVEEEQEKEEGSRRELGPAPNSTFMSPLLTDTCPLLEVVPPGVIHQLLSLLSVRELCKVASTCNNLREAVKEFLRHEIASLHLEEMMNL